MIDPNSKYTWPFSFLLEALSNRFQKYPMLIELQTPFSINPNNHGQVWKGNKGWVIVTYQQFCSFHFISIWLNWINLEWNWTIWANWSTTFDSFRLRFALPLKVCKLLFISLVIGNSMKLVPNPNIAKHLTASITLVMNIYCRKTAAENPSGVFVSNGNLLVI